MKEKKILGLKGKKIFEIITFMIVILIFIILIPSFKKAFEIDTEKYDCYETICSKYTIEQFNECSYLGYESTGFLSREVFWLCDGVKMPNNCIEHEKVITNKTMISFGMDCKEKNK